EQLSQNRNILTSLELAVPGLSIQPSEQRTSCGSQLRGRNVAYQINGVPVNEDLRAGSCTGPFKVNPFALQRVEALRGGTALYGSGSPGGIINLITKRATGPEVEMDYVAQTSFNTSDTTGTFITDFYAGVGQDRGAFDYYVGAGYTDSGISRSGNGNLVFGDEFESLNIVTALGYRNGDQEYRLTGSWSDESLGDSAYSTGEPLSPGVGTVVLTTPHPQRDDGADENLTLALSFTDEDLLAHEVNLSVFLQDQKIIQRENFFSAADGDSFFASDRENQRIGLRSTLVRRYNLSGGELTTSYGADFTRNDFFRFIVDPVGGAVTGYLTPSFYLNTTAAFGQVEWSFDRLTLTGGARQEWYAGAIKREGFDPTLSRVATPGDFDNSTLGLFNVGAVYDLSETLQLYGGFSQGAELSQLGRAARGATNPGSISNEPATSDQYELGLRGGHGDADFGLVAYYSESASSSRLQPDPTCTPEELATICTLIPLRIPERTWGLEANTTWSVTSQFDLSGVFTLQRGEVQDQTTGEWINFSTDRAVPLRVTVRGDYRPVDALSLGLQVNYYGASSYFSPTQEAIGLIDTDAVTLVSASAAYDVGSVEVYVAADNLLDNSYVNPSTVARNFDQYEAPGRRVTFGVRGRF
ncbi:MAG: TonB-dependent receptor plug domain-containing protein, partial [Rhodospirillaceae bacterium]